MLAFEIFRCFPCISRKSTTSIVNEILELIKTEKTNNWFTSEEEVKLALREDDIIPHTSNVLFTF